LKYHSGIVTVKGMSEARTSHHSTWLFSWSFWYCSGCRWQRADVTESCWRSSESVWSLCSISGN